MVRSWKFRGIWNPDGGNWLIPLDVWGILFEPVGGDFVETVVGGGNPLANEVVQVLLEPCRNGGVCLCVNIGDAALSLWEGGSSSCRLYPRRARNGLVFFGGLGGSPYPLMHPIGSSLCDVLVTGGVANRAAVAAGVHHGGGGGNHARSAHPLSGFGGVGVDIVSRERCGSEVGSWDPWYEDPGLLEEMSDLLDVGDGK